MMTMTKTQKFHNQFVLGPAYMDALANWKKLQINEYFFLTTHPDLNVTRHSSETLTVTLIGFILDPFEPQADDTDILKRLVSEAADRHELRRATYRLAGRWILIVEDNDGIRLFNDAAGLRQVFYTDVDRCDHLWCASQPKMIASINNFGIDPAAVEHIDSFEFRKDPEFRWPGDGSPYKEIKHLLPNHLLDLKTGRATRYWPDAPLNTQSVGDAAESVSRMLSGLMQGAARRFDLAVSLTAGLDSRVVLAACKSICDRISVMTVRQIDKPSNYADVTVPAELVSKVGLNLDIVNSSWLMDDAFIDAFKQNTTLPHYIYAPDAQAILNYYGQRKVVAVGSVSEIGRLSFRSMLRKPETDPTTTEDLCRLQRMGTCPYNMQSFGDWMDNLGNIYNIPILDMFEWEQGHGNWLAMCQLEFDIAWKDLFAPFNCRNLLTTLLSVDRVYRDAPNYDLFLNIIERLWPDLLSVPINPHKNKTRNKRLSDSIKSIIPDPAKKMLKQVLNRL